MSKVIRKTIKLSVPENDKTVFDWFNAQDNMSMAIRRLIHLDVAKNGYRDILCDETMPNSMPDNMPDDLIVTKPKESKLNGESSLVNPHQFDDKINTALPKPMAKSDTDDNNSKNSSESRDIIDTPLATESKAESASKMNTDSDGFIDPEVLLNGF